MAGGYKTEKEDQGSDLEGILGGFGTKSKKKKDKTETDKKTVRLGEKTTTKTETETDTTKTETEATETTDTDTSGQKIVMTREEAFKKMTYDEQKKFTYGTEAEKKALSIKYGLT